jgi:hypothetical protein
LLMDQKADRRPDLGVGDVAMERWRVRSKGIGTFAAVVCAVQRGRAGAGPVGLSSFAFSHDESSGSMADKGLTQNL